MKNLIMYRSYCNHVEVPDSVWSALEAGGKNEADAYVDLAPLRDYLDGPEHGRPSWPCPDEEVEEELEVLSLE